MYKMLVDINILSQKINILLGYQTKKNFVVVMKKQFDYAKCLENLLE